MRKWRMKKAPQPIANPKVGRRSAPALQCDIIVFDMRRRCVASLIKALGIQFDSRMVELVRVDEPLTRVDYLQVDDGNSAYGCLYSTKVECAEGLCPGILFIKQLRAVTCSVKLLWACDLSGKERSGGRRFVKRLGV